MSLRIIALGLPVLAVIAATYFAITTYRDTAQENAKLVAEVTKLKDDMEAAAKAQKAIGSTIDKNETTTTRVIERTREIEGAIHALPTTTACLEQPAIRTLLDGLRDNERSATRDLP